MVVEMLVWVTFNDGSGDDVNGGSSGSGVDGVLAASVAVVEVVILQVAVRVAVSVRYWL